MASVTVTATFGLTCHYWIIPQAVFATNGDGVFTFDIVHGWAAGLDGPVAASFPLDDSALWNIRLSFLGAPPVEFDGLDVSGGGDLFELLAAQGWISL